MTAKHLVWGACLLVPGLLVGCGGGDSNSGGEDSSSAAKPTSGGGGAAPYAALQTVAQERGLTPDDLVAAAKTFQPSGRHDDYLMFASDGHGGQMLVIGVPSMRILRVIGVFTPEPWQGWGYGAGQDVLDEGKINGKDITWGDTHHPALSETAGDYDGQFCFINDKANARLAVIDLRDFETKQIVKNPLSLSDHGGAMVTPNTDYIIEGGQYGHPLGWDYAPMEEYVSKYRGMVTLWKFDRDSGRIDQSKSFALELPPYWQDLFDAGKLVSDGWIFGNSFNTELAADGGESGTPPYEAGASQRDNDYMHVINLRKAEALYRAGKAEIIKGFPVLSIQTLVDEGVLYFVPEPKSPHGVDVSPDGAYMVVSGKLDPHVTVYSFDKIQKTIAAKNWEPDQFGVPVLDFDSCVEAQIEVGLGPLHTQFDNQGYAYTSLFLEPAVARWTMGGPLGAKNPEPDWTLVGKVPVQYNVGHICAAEGDTVSPDGKYLVSMNKWAIDRFTPVGPLVPQNFQLVDIADTGDTMKVIYDMPVGMGEPHYAQMIKADKLKPWKVYPEVGWSPETQSVRLDAAQKGKERVERNGTTVDVYMTAVRSHFTPEYVEAVEGDHIRWHITNIERAYDATHGFAVPAYNINLSLEPGEAQVIEFVADRSGTYPFYCSEFCSALHLEMMGYFLVKPAE
ncbi:MAG: Sec-dependent nitrous-oxide reductase [Phycisphaerales bacterium]|nr:Sec-dependent nitrous-oxide reductase [Phycisphaerales bacterium]